MSAIVLAAIERELLRYEWREHLRRQPTTDLGVEAAVLIREERALRDSGSG